MFWAFVATLSSFVGNREIKPSNKTKEEIVEGEVETDLADSGAQSGSVSSSWLVICQWRTAIFFQVKESGSGPLDLNVVVSGLQGSFQ